MNRFNKTNDIEITGDMDLGAYSPLELAEEQQLNEISNRLLANYMEKTKQKRRDKQYNAGKMHALYTINQKYSFRTMTEDGEMFIFSVVFKEGYGFIINAYDRTNDHTYELMPEHPTYTIDRKLIIDTTLGYVIDNLRAGERMKFKGLCQAANELNGNTKDEHENLRGMIREGLAEMAGEQFTHQLGPDGDVVYGKDEQGFFVYIKKNLSVKYFNTPEEAEEYARKVYKAIRLRKNAERQEFDKQMSLDETIQKHVVDVMKRYTEGNASANEANKAIMDLADSGAKKTNKVNESDANTKYVLYADTTKSGNSDFISYTNDGIKKGNIKYLLKYLPEESILDNSDKEKKPVSRKDIEKKYEVALEKDNYLVVWVNTKAQGDIRVYKKQTKMNESFEDEYAKMNELAKDEFYVTLKQLVSIVKEDSIIDAAEAVDDYPAAYCVYGSEPEYEGKLPKLRTSITKSVIRTLYNYDVVCADDETLTVNVEQSNVPEAAQLCIKLQQMSQQTPINESYAQDGNYTHFAVHKGTNKIVNGWDYSGYDPEELRMYKNDYFTQDLIDYELDPKQYTILTVKGCKARGINPYDDSQWANGYELNEKTGEGTDPYYGERHDMENKKIENMGNMTWTNFKK